jgi:hypothetical protein
LAAFRAFGSSLFTITTSLSIFRAYGSELIDSGVRNTTSQAPTTYSQSTALLACHIQSIDGPASLPYLIPQSTALPAHHTSIDGPASLPYLNRRPCQPTIPQSTALLACPPLPTDGLTCSPTLYCQPTALFTCHYAYLCF